MTIAQQVEQYLNQHGQAKDAVKQVEDAGFSINETDEIVDDYTGKVLMTFYVFEDGSTLNEDFEYPQSCLMNAHDWYTELTMYQYYG